MRGEDRKRERTTKREEGKEEEERKEKKTKEGKEEGEAPPATATTAPSPLTPRAAGRRPVSCAHHYLPSPVTPPGVHAACEQRRVIHNSFFCWAEPSLCIWAGFGPAHRIGADPPVQKTNFQNFIFKILWLFHLFLYGFFLISVCILCRKNINPVLKYPIFIKTSKIQKQNWKKKKNIFVHTVKCLKVKKIILCFSYTKKTMF